MLADLKNDSEFNVFKPAKLTTPTLVLFGDRDPGVVLDDAGKFFARLASPTSRWSCCRARTTPRRSKTRTTRGSRRS